MLNKLLTELYSFFTCGDSRETLDGNLNPSQYKRCSIM